ncbi:MAG: S41 family peptidase [Endomicrobiales bacterium]|nr:S41 family peptidase [Endomicrobiales bacterium]
MKKRNLLIGVLLVCFGFLILSPKVRAEADKTYDQLKLFIDVMSIIQDNYVEERNGKELIVGALKGMVKTLDPFSQFMEPDDYKELKTETEGQFGGLGIRISIKNEWLTVVTPLPRTPAYRLGILPDDKIIKIENESTLGITVNDAVKKLRGMPGTKVKISIAREGVVEPIDYTITREIIKIETIKSKMLTDNIGYIQLSEFNSNSYRDMSKALEDLSKAGMGSLILDLRNNPGGLLDIAVSICELFVGDDKLVVYTQGRKQESRREYRAIGKALYGKLPMIVLVNRGSASASEIVSGSMQDLKRALIMGTTTFGKGSVQTVLPLPDGNALRLTTAKYYTASGRTIHRDEKTGKGGVMPDIIIDVPKEIESKLYAQSEEIYNLKRSTDNAKKNEERVSDTVLERAIDILKARTLINSLKEE